MSDRRDRLTGFAMLAIIAANKAGTPDVPPAAQVHDMDLKDINYFVRKAMADPRAAAIRDQLINDFERRCREPGWTCVALDEWYTKTFAIHIGTTGIHRCMKLVKVFDSKIQDAADMAATLVDVANSEGPEKLGEAATARAQQLYFQLLLGAKSEQLEDEEEAKRLVRIVDSLAKLQSSTAQTRLANQRLLEMQKAFDEQMAAVQRRVAGAGKLTPEMIKEAKEGMFGKVA